MNKEFAELNEKYNDDTYPIFPFVGKNKITLLKAGFYRKHKAKFRGITAVYDAETKEYEFPLYGMYHIAEDIVIVPEELEINENKQALLNAALTSGYKQISSPPKFVTFKFSPESEEARLALANKVEHQYSTNSEEITE